MRIERLRVDYVRNLEDLEIEPASRLNLITGVNASGKTALLESMYLLARARSFRTHRIEDVIQHGRDELRVSAHIEHGEDGALVTGIERSRGKLLLRYHGQTIKTVSAHARRIPVVLMTPASHELVLGGPTARRHWLDWAMFHVKPEYLEAWRDYHRALRHRNAALKAQADLSTLEGFEQILARSGTLLTDARTAYLEALDKAFTAIAEGLWPDTPRIRLKPGWSGDLFTVLSTGRAGDREAGFSRQGPHRADVEFSVGPRALSACFSRGQCKLFVSLLVLAQAGVIEALSGEAPLLLLDDFAAELDLDANRVLLELLHAQRTQVFVTTTHWDGEWGLAGVDRVFHVERGKVRKVVE